MANLILWSNVAVEYAPVRTGGATQIASWLRQHGYTVKVIDFCHIMSTDELVAITEKHIGADTLAIGVSSTFWDLYFKHDKLLTGFLEPQWVIDAREKLESKHDVFWILGGSKSYREPYKFHWVKFHGFAEDAILQWMDQNSSKLVRRTLFDITCLEHSRHDDDFIQSTEPLTIELTRGCKFKCKFCSYPLIGKKPGTYMRAPHLIKEEMLRNYEKWGTTKYYFQDDTVNESMEKVDMIADIAQSLPFRLQWIGYNRLDLIGTNPEMAQRLKDSGMRSAHFGIESFHEDASRAVGKGWNGKYAKDYLLYLKDFWGDEINWYMSLIIGLPGESREDILDTEKWCVDNDMYAWGYFGLSINRIPDKVWKSEFEVNCEEYGYTFPDPQNTFMWYNDKWNAYEASIFAKDLNQVAMGRSRPAGWLLTEMTALGDSFEDIMKLRRDEHDWDSMKVRTKAFVDKYVSYQLR